MAIEDFYIANPNYSTRISFDFKDYQSDSIGAASAGTFPSFSYLFFISILSSALFQFDFTFLYFYYFLNPY